MHQLNEPVKLPKVTTYVIDGQTYVPHDEHLKAVQAMADAVWDKAYRFCHSGMTVGMIRRAIWNHWQVPKGEERS